MWGLQLDPGAVLSDNALSRDPQRRPGRLWISSARCARGPRSPPARGARAFGCRWIRGAVGLHVVHCLRKSLAIRGNGRHWLRRGRCRVLRPPRQRPARRANARRPELGPSKAGARSWTGSNAVCGGRGAGAFSRSRCPALRDEIDRRPNTTSKRFLDWKLLRYAGQRAHRAP